MQSSGIGLNDKYEYADEYFLSDEGLDRETDDRPSDGFLSEEELCKFGTTRGAFMVKFFVLKLYFVLPSCS